MKTRTLGLLLVAILAMAMIAWFNLHGRSEVPVDESIGTLVFPQLKANLLDVSALELRGVGLTTTLVKRDDRWRVEEKGGYTADFDKLLGVLNGLAAATYVEKKTARPANFAQLGLEGIDAGDGKSALVTVRRGDQTESLLVGDESGAGQGFFVRRPDDNQVWLADKISRINTDPTVWINPMIINVDEARIIRASFTGVSGEHLTVTRDGPSDGAGEGEGEGEGEKAGWKVTDLPVDKELKYPTVADSVARTLINVRANDVRPREGEPWQAVATAVFGLDDGREILVAARVENDGRYWLQFGLNPATAADSVEADSADRVGEAPAGITVDAAAFAGWEFNVSEFVFGQFTRTMKDMVKADEKEASATEQ
jgi:hypothetical protein